MQELTSCSICPRHCQVNRNRQERGFCQAGANLKIGRAALHRWEEPCLSGTNGSGTIFFSYCNLQCIFCQNFEISSKHAGKEVSIERFVEICFELEQKGATNINLVTPTHYIPQIREGLKIAKKKGLTIPIVYNSSGYEDVTALRSLEGLIDIYLPDFKYFDDSLAIRFSHASHYFAICKEALKEMIRQVGKPQFDRNGILQKGVIVRHLILPGHIDDSKRILHYLYHTYHDSIFISIMNQYTVTRLLPYPELNRSVSEKEYEEVIQYAIQLGIENAFIQEQGTDQASFIPSFQGEGV